MCWIRVDGGMWVARRARVGQDTLYDPEMDSECIQHQRCTKVYSD